MKISILNGSPRAEKSNTQQIADAFAKGAEKAGAQVQTVFLAHKTIHYCRGCFSCWTHTPGRCAQQDDMPDILKQIEGSDVLVFATPVYVDNVTAILKTFIDRLITLGDPYFEKDEQGESRHRLHSSDIRPAKLAVISNCGFPEQTHFQVISHYFKRMARNMHTEVIAEIYRGGGELLRETPVFLMPIIHKYKALVAKAGEEVVKNSKLSDETRNELEKPLIPDEQYIRSANHYWDTLLKK